MKQKLLLKTMLLLFALIAGSSSVWAGDTWEEASLASLTSTDVFVIVGNNYAMTNDNGTGSAPATVAVTVADGKITSTVDDNIKWNVSGNATDGFTFYPNGSSTTWLYCNTTAGSGSNNNIRVGTGNRKVFELTNDNQIITKDDNTARYLSIYNNADWRGYVNTNSAPAIKFYKKVSSGNSCATPTFSPAAGVYTSAQNVTISTTTEGATIYYTTNGSTPTSSSTQYTGTIPVSTTTTIKAIAVKTSYDDSSVASATYTILEHAGTEADPYSVADARAAIDANSGVSEVYATGIVSGIVTAYSSQNKNISFNISADGLTTSDQLQAYRCKKGDGGNDPDVADIQVGDVVIVKGNLTKYNSTYEFAASNVLISLEHPTTPLISVTPSSLTGFFYIPGNGPSAAKTISVAGSNLTADISLSASTNYEMCLTEDGNYTNSLTLTQTTGTVTATTVYVRLKAGLASNDYAGTITLTSTGATDVTVDLSGSVVATASLPFIWTGTSSAGKAELDAETGVEVNLGSDYASSNAPYRLKFDGTTKYVVIYTDEKPEAVAFTAKIFGAANTGSKMKVQASDDGINFTDIEEFTIKGDANATFEFTTSNAFAAKHRVVKLALSVKDQNVGVGTISISSAPILYTMNAYEWATFVSDKALDFTGSGVKAYGVTGHSGNALTLTSELTTVAANTPLLLNAAEGEYNINVVASGDDVDGNLLVAGTGIENGITKVDGKTRYVLGIEEGKATFLKIVDTPATVPTNKAYLEFDGDVPAPVLNLGFDGDDKTGINMVKGEGFKVNGEFYNLNGQRVAQPTKGLYIVNGKKIIK